LERETGNRKDEGRSFLQAGRAQVTAGINYKRKDTHQRIIQEEEKSNTPMYALLINIMYSRSYN